MIGDMRALRSLAPLVPALVSALTVACFDGAVPAGAVVECVADEDCPSGTRCEELVERCVPLGFTLPLAEGQQVTTSEDAAVDVVIAGDDDATVVVASAAFVGSVTVVDAAARVVRYTPAADFVGRDRFSVALARDGLVGPPVDVDVTVAGTDDPPFASDTTVDCVEDTPCEIVLQGGDPDAGDAVVFVMEAPTRGALSTSVSVSGAVTYLPLANGTGDDTFAFRVEGTGGTATATATVHVAAVNDAPALGVAGAVVGPRGDAVALDVVDADADAVVVNVVDVPDGFAVVVDGDVVDVVPPVGFVGAAAVGLALDDGTTVAAATLALDVHAPRSCAAWREWLGAGAASGTFAIDVDGPGPAPAHDVHCDQTTAGGGWTLVAKMDGRTTTWGFSSPLWTNDDTLRPEDATLAAGDAKLPGFASLPAEEVLVVSADFDGAVRGSLRAPLPHDVTSLRALFADRGFVDLSESLSLLAFRVMVDNDQLQLPGQGFLVGVNVLGGEFDAAARLGLTDTNFNVSTGIGLRRFGGEPTAGNNNQAALVYVYVRSNDHSLARPAVDCLAHQAQGAAADGLYSDVSGGLLRCDQTTDGGGFTRLIRFDAGFDVCPDGLASELIDGVLACGRGQASVGAVASTTLTPPSGYSALRVRTSLLATGVADAFLNRDEGLEGRYLDGLSFTTGSPRTHLLSVAVGGRALGLSGDCPCFGAPQPPEFAAPFACDRRVLPEADVAEPLYDDDFNVCRDGVAADDDIHAAFAPVAGAVEVRLMTDSAPAEENVVIRSLEVWSR